MSTFLMVATTKRDLHFWSAAWLDMNSANVGSHRESAGVTEMRNGDVYLWRTLEVSALRGLEVSAVFLYERPFVPTPEQREALEVLRAGPLSKNTPAV